VDFSGSRKVLGVYQINAKWQICRKQSGNANATDSIFEFIQKIKAGKLPAFIPKSTSCICSLKNRLIKNPIVGYCFFLYSY
jgi:hypothetical protein